MSERGKVGAATLAALREIVERLARDGRYCTAGCMEWSDHHIPECPGHYVEFNAAVAREAYALGFNAAIEKASATIEAERKRMSSFDSDVAFDRAGAALDLYAMVGALAIGAADGGERK